MQELKIYYDEEEFLYLLITNTNFMDITIIKSKYLHNKNIAIFKILMDDHKKHKEIAINNLLHYRDFDLEYYTSLLEKDVFYINKEKKLKELEKAIIENYKLEQVKLLIDSNNEFDIISKKIYELNEINDYKNETISENDIIIESTTKKTKLELGYPLLDNALNLSQGDLLILAGGTGTGKTAFALNLLLKLSKDYQCVYFNMEMSKNILYRRLIAIQSGISLKELNDYSKLNDEQKNMLMNSAKEIGDRKILLINKSLDINEMNKTIVKIKQEKHLIIFIDHIGLIKSSGNSLYEKMTNVAKELRSISINYGCTVIGLCQLSRESQRSDTPPKLQDLRDSGEIEQSARKVLLLYNKEKDSQQREQQMEIIIAKNDDGMQNAKKEFIFDRYTQKFTEKYI